MLMDMSLQSHNGRQSQGDSGVPRLDITLDNDHLSWVKDQAARVQRPQTDCQSVHALKVKHYRTQADDPASLNVPTSHPAPQAEHEAKDKTALSCVVG
ncbi:hypothetical protein ACOMHN_033700 [Nucella lapillus]